MCNMGKRRQNHPLRDDLERLVEGRREDLEGRARHLLNISDQWLRCGKEESLKEKVRYC